MSRDARDPFKLLGWRRIRSVIVMAATVSAALALYAWVFGVVLPPTSQTGVRFGLSMLPVVLGGAVVGIVAYRRINARVNREIAVLSTEVSEFWFDSGIVLGALGRETGYLFCDDERLVLYRTGRVRTVVSIGADEIVEVRTKRRFGLTEVAILCPDGWAVVVLSLAIRRVDERFTITRQTVRGTATFNALTRGGRLRDAPGARGRH